MKLLEWLLPTNHPCIHDNFKRKEIKFHVKNLFANL